MKHSDNVACKIAEKLRELLLSDKYSKSDEFISSRRHKAVQYNS